MKIMIRRVWILLLLLAAGLSVKLEAAQPYQVLHHFGAGTDGNTPKAGLVLSGDMMYGTTSSGGTSNCGAIFRIRTDASGYLILQNLSSYYERPLAALTLSGATLYGTTGPGSDLGGGHVFKINTNRSGFGMIALIGSLGSYGSYDSVVMSDGVLYGGSWDYDFGDDPASGYVFRVGTDGSNFTAVKNFVLSEGGSPGGLVISGSTIYGRTVSITGEGTNGYGTVFKVETNGSGFTIIKRFVSALEGNRPQGNLLLVGSRLYGVTASGGSAGGGTVYALNTDGTGFTVLKSFNGSDGAGPLGGVVLSGSELYGMTSAGGAFDAGTLYKLNTNGSGFTVLKDFKSSDGTAPYGELVVSGTMLYGTTSTGGSNDSGVVFALDMTPASPIVTTHPQGSNVLAGADVTLEVAATGMPERFGYQWFFRDFLIPDATNAVLALTSVSRTNSGYYFAFVTNASGGGASSNALLLVRAPQRILPLVQTGENRYQISFGDFDGGPVFDWDLTSLEVQSSPDLSATNWVTLTNALVISNGVGQVEFLVTNTPPQQFYRIRMR